MNRPYIIWVLAEIAIVIICISAYEITWRNDKAKRLLKKVDEKELSLIALNNAISGGLIAVSILLPVSVGLAIFSVEKAVVQAGLPYIKFAVCYFLVSLLAAIWNLFRLPTMVQLSRDLAYDRPTALFEIIQLLFLLFGAGRLVGAVASI